ncbi:MAG: DNA replication protein [Candidatus Brocadiaceae bacterium]|nr:DNA replication protein [Candidatus Brocadiaceae bacterium]
MAEKRMFTKTIVDSDVFLDMPQSAQNLYFHLNMRADDEGFINSPKKIMRMVSSNQNDMDILLAKRYLLSFPSGVIVVKHWKMHNAIRQDRLKETMYLEEKSQLITKENGSYTDNIKLLQPSDNQVTDNLSPRLDKIRLEETSIDYKEHFESVWKMYPLKKGKGRISESKLKSLSKYTIEEWKVIIERYDNSVKDKNFLLHGSTFFNGGYIDYLDENYEQTTKTGQVIEEIDYANLKGVF